MSAFPSLTDVKAVSTTLDLRSIRRPSVCLDYSLGISGGLAILAGLIFPLRSSRCRYLEVVAARTSRPI